MYRCKKKQIILKYLPFKNLFLTTMTKFIIMRGWMSGFGIFQSFRQRVQIRFIKMYNVNIFLRKREEKK